MQQIKIFRGIENDLPALEKQINSWLESAGVKIINIFGNIAPQSPPPPNSPGGISQSAWAPSDVMLVVHYEK
jgi:hypothetical protein